MGGRRLLTGIDVGSRAVKIVQLREKGDRLVLARAIKIPLTATPDSSQLDTIEKRLAARLDEAGIDRLRGPVTLAGPDLILRYHAAVASGSLQVEDIVRFEIEEVSKKIDGGVAYSHRQMTLPEPLRLPGEERADWVILMAMAKNHYLDHLDRQLAAGGVRVDYLTPPAIALAALLAAVTPIEPDEIAMLIDIGAEHTTVVVVEGDNPLFLRTMPFGGEAVTRAIGRRLRIGQAEAEKAKRSSAHVMIHPPGGATDQRQMAISEIATHQIEQLCSIVQSSLRFAEAQLRCERLSPSRIFLTGGTAKLPGIVPYMQDRFGHPVFPLNAHNRWDLTKLSADEQLLVSQNGPQFAAAVGCALTARSPATALPLRSDAQQERRLFRRRHLFAYAALLVVILSLVARSADRLLKRRDLLADRPARMRTHEAVESLVDQIATDRTERASLIAAKQRTEAAVARHRFVLTIWTGMTGGGPPSDHRLVLPKSLHLTRLDLVELSERERQGQPFDYAVQVELGGRHAGDSSIATVTAYLKTVPFEYRYVGEVSGGGYRVRFYPRRRTADGPAGPRGAQ